MWPEQSKVDVRRCTRIDQLFDGTELLAGGLDVGSWGLAAFGAVFIEHVADGFWRERDELCLCSDVDQAGQRDPLGGGTTAAGKPPRKGGLAWPVNNREADQAFLNALFSPRLAARSLPDPSST